jgi:hypothetical protein
MLQERSAGADVPSPDGLLAGSRDRQEKDPAGDHRAGSVGLGLVKADGYAGRYFDSSAWAVIEPIPRA